MLGLHTHLFGHGPDEPDALSRHGHDDLIGVFASGGELSVPFTQAHRGFPPDVLEFLG
jgi:hypothetical protein